MSLWPEFQDVPGILPALNAAGIEHARIDNMWHFSDVPAAQAFAASWDALSAARSIQADAAAAHKWEVISGGHTTATGIPLYTSIDDITMITGLYNTACAGSPMAVYTFKDRSKIYRSLTVAQVQSLYLDVSAWVQLAFLAEQALTQEIMAAPTWQAVMAIDVTAGWPANS